MLEHTYKYQNYLRNNSPRLGPFYTAFVVALEQQIEILDKSMGYTAPIKSNINEMAPMSY
ncbi:MAG: hypothetical protein NKF70_11205 [Methanobacterium sp. ERen5]|nr:MAG: hypothetical protein NKF70_11205 [Methanobacterium sp. ERen5]